MITEEFLDQVLILEHIPDGYDPIEVLRAFEKFGKDLPKAHRICERKMLELLETLFRERPDFLKELSSIAL